MKRWSVVGITVALVVLLLPGAAIGQDDRSSHWGVTFASAPSWNASSTFKVVFDADAMNLQGSDFEVGAVRGRDFGGEWGVSYFYRRVAGNSRVDRNLPSEFCYNATSCASYATYLLQRDASYQGVRLHKFIPFGGSIAGRLQIGVNVGGGVGWGRNTLEQHDLAPQFLTVPGRTTGCIFIAPEGCVVGITQGETISTVPARQLLVEQLKVFPLFTLEGAAAVRLAPGFKVRFGVGFNFPDTTAVSIGASYLFGAAR